MREAVLLQTSSSAQEPAHVGRVFLPSRLPARAKFPEESAGTCPEKKDDSCDQDCGSWPTPVKARDGASPHPDSHRHACGLDCNTEAKVPLKTSRKEAALENVQHSCGAFLIGSAVILSELLCHVLD